MPLAPAERSRLVALLGMLGSEFPGERAAAALHADRMRRDLGLAWEDILAAPAVEDDWRAQAAEAARYPGLLTPWERNFLRVLPSFEEISDRQRLTLERIVAKVLR